MRYCCATFVVALMASHVSMACEVKTDQAVLDTEHGSQVIPVQAARGERCVLIDFLSPAGIQTYKTLWRPVEKYGPVTANRLGRLKREYQTHGDTASINRYVYLAGQTPGEEVIAFSAFPGSVEKRVVAYRIVIR